MMSNFSEPFFFKIPKTNAPLVTKHDLLKCQNGDKKSIFTPINEDKIIPEILSPGEKKIFCKPLRSIKRRSMIFTFPYSKSLGDVKSTEFIHHLKSSTDTPKSVIDKVVIVEENIDNERLIRMAINIESKDTIPTGGFLWKLYKKVFPNYHHKIQMDVSDNSVYLKKARSLVAPLKAQEMDMKPFVYGETLYELLVRIENSMRGNLGSMDIDGNWRRYPLELQRAVLESNRNWLYFIGSNAYKSLGERYPYTCRNAFDSISKLMPVPIKEGLEDPVTIRQHENRERQVQKIWDDLYDPVKSRKRKVGNMSRTLGHS